ncbi:MAG: hypothetical protein AAF681_00645 [Pseudomonadota bacterium]
MIMRRVMRGGLNMGMDAISQRASKKPENGATKQPSRPSPQQARQQAETNKRAKQSMRAMRRLGRF